MGLLAMQMKVMLFSPTPPGYGKDGALWDSLVAWSRDFSCVTFSFSMFHGTCEIGYTGAILALLCRPMMTLGFDRYSVREIDNSIDIQSLFEQLQYQGVHHYEGSHPPLT